ncbi:MAG: hypothetical protein HY543_07655, partial [Deltaproteobacteria bacterium]|nr:hypothetical protein [Deltaproteobacteria bacterium]
MPRQFSKRLLAVLGIGLAVCLCLWGCDGSVAPSGGQATPVAVELPKGFSLPKNVAVDLGEVIQGALAGQGKSLGKSLAGSTPVAKAYGSTQTAGLQLDAFFDLFDGVHLPLDASLTVGTAATASGGKVVVDFTPLPEEPPFPAFNYQITGVDCHASCAGHGGGFPMCARVYVDGKRALIAKIVRPVTAASNGAGCFTAFRGQTMEITESAILDGSESVVMNGVWHQPDAKGKTLELFYTATKPDAAGTLVQGLHALSSEVRELDATTVTAGATTDYRSSETESHSSTISGIFQRGSDRIKA